MKPSYLYKLKFSPPSSGIELKIKGSWAMKNKVFLIFSHLNHHISTLTLYARKAAQTQKMNYCRFKGLPCTHELAMGILGVHTLIWDSPLQAFWIGNYQNTGLQVEEGCFFLFQQLSGYVVLSTGMLGSKIWQSRKYARHTFQRRF